MTKITKSLLTVASSIALATTLSAADELKILPIFTDDNYCGQIEVAAAGGVSQFSDKDRTTYGIELSFDCPVFTLPGEHVLRQQLTVLDFGDDTMSIEMNPYYFLTPSKDFHIGFGPGIGGMKTGDDWIFTYQAGAGVKYYINDFIVGADIRWQDTTSTKFPIDSTRAIAKVGYRF